MVLRHRFPGALPPRRRRAAVRGLRNRARPSLRRAPSARSTMRCRRPPSSAPLRSALAPDGAFWPAHAYDDETSGFFSYVHALDEDGVVVEARGGSATNSSPGPCRPWRKPQVSSGGRTAGRTARAISSTSTRRTRAPAPTGPNIPYVPSYSICGGPPRRTGGFGDHAMFGRRRDALSRCRCSRSRGTEPRRLFSAAIMLHAWSQARTRAGRRDGAARRAHDLVLAPAMRGARSQARHAAMRLTRPRMEAGSPFQARASAGKRPLSRNPTAAGGRRRSSRVAQLREADALDAAADDSEASRCRCRPMAACWQRLVDDVVVTFDLDMVGLTTWAAVYPISARMRLEFAARCSPHSD